MTATTDVRVPGQRVGEFTSKLETFPEVEQGSDEWMDQRRGMLTASVIGRLVTSRSMAPIEYGCPACDAAAGASCLSKVKKSGEAGSPIKTVHPERTEHAASMRDQSPRIVELATGDDVRGLTALLAAERITGHTDDVFVSADMQRGTEEEPLARDAYAEHFGVEVDELGFMVRSWGACELGFSPDGLIGEDGLIEIKSRRQKKHLLTVVSDEVPPENMAQIQAGLLVSGRKWADYVDYSGGMELWVKRVYPDKVWFAALTAAVERFEKDAIELVAAYRKGVVGMPMTERLDLDMVI